MLRQIVEKEVPLWDLPKTRHFVIVEANHERGDQIEFLAHVGEGTETFDSLDDAANAEQPRDVAKHCHSIHIETKSGMTEQLRDVEKISGAAAQIEDALRARKIEFELANSADVNFDPPVEIEIFWPVRAGVCYSISLANRLKPSWIDCFDNPFCIQRKAVRAQEPERMLSRAGEAPAIYKLSYFMAKFHR